MSNRAWVTLATNDSYGLGALVLAHSLKRAGSAYPSVVLITPSVTDAMRDRLSAVFAEVITVDVLDSRDATHLALLQRPELGITFTKIHCWNLTQYEKCVFLDADTLVVQNCDELFEREELSAAPDVGWPDCFNSGVFVFKPSADTFSKLVKFAQERGSFDGGDQGLLNSFFSDWAHGDIRKHLPFLYNVTSAAFYSYIPALKHYGQNMKIIHFIGAAKPWLQQFNWDSNTVDAPDHIKGLLQLWWDIFVSQVHTQLDTTMTGVAGNLARVTPGAASTQREAIDELARRQGWEAGNIDYMGADSFDNIWAKISQTLNQPRSSPPRQSPPKQPSPPKEQPASVVPEVQPEASKEPVAPAVEVAKEAAAETPSQETKSEPAVASEAASQKDIKGEVPPPAVIPPVAVPVESKSAEAVEVKPETPATAPVVVESPVVASAPVKTVEKPVAPVAPVEAAAAPAASDTPSETVKPVEKPAEVKSVEKVVEAPQVPKAEAKVEAAAPQEKAEPKKTEIPVVPPTPPVTPKSTPEASTPVSEDAPKLESSIEKAVEAVKEEVKSTEASPTAQASDSPPLANTPSKEEAPSVPVAKSTEEAAQETRL